MQTQRQPLAGRVARPLRSGTAWGMLALAAAGVLALLVGTGGSAITWVMERLGSTTFGWPGDLVFATGTVGTALSIPAAAWATSYTSTQRSPLGRAMLAAGLGVGAFVAIGAIDRAPALVGGAGMTFAVALPFDPWHRLTARLVPIVVAVLLGAALLDWTGLAFILVMAAISYPVAALLVWVGDTTWRAITRRARST